MSAAEALEAEIRADTEYLPFAAPAGMGLFQLHDIANHKFCHTPTASPRTFPMLSLITRSAWLSRLVEDLLISTSLCP